VEVPPAGKQRAEAEGKQQMPERGLLVVQERRMLSGLKEDSCLFKVQDRLRYTFLE
jgi:hypothetical protein